MPRMIVAKSHGIPFSSFKGEDFFKKSLVTAALFLATIMTDTILKVEMPIKVDCGQVLSNSVH